MSVLRVLGLACVLVVVCGCQTQRVVSVRGGFSGLGRMPGGQGGIQPDDAEADVDKDHLLKVLANNPQNKEGEAVEGRPLRRKLQDGGYLLIARAPRELMQHLSETLRDQEYTLLENQVLSQRTRSAYLARGRNPHEAVDWLVRNQADVQALLDAMPAGELTPGVLMTPLGDNAFSLTIPGGADVLELKFKELDVVLENSQFRLVVIR